MKSNDDGLGGMVMELKDLKSPLPYGENSGLLQSPAIDDGEALHIALHMSKSDDNPERSNVTPTSGEYGSGLGN